MFRNTWMKMVVVPLMALVVVLAGSRTAEAQVKPFKITGGGVADYVPLPGDPPAFHYAVGQATGLGRYYGEGKVRVDAITSPTTGEFSSAVPFVFTGANGDKLAFHYGRTDFGAEGPGVVTLHDAGGGEVIAVWVAEFTPVAAASTGRFKKVIGGSVIVTAVTEPFVLGSDDPVPYVWSGEGTLEFRRGKR
jgi:hypothetical protein